MMLIRSLIWKFDLLVYRLFFWRWNPRLKADANLAYAFSVFMQAWTNARPPRDREAMDRFIYESLRGCESSVYDPTKGIKAFIK